MCGVINKEILLNCDGTKYIKPMNEKELRIGNYLNQIDKNKDIKIAEVWGLIDGFINPYIKEEWCGSAFGGSRHYQYNKYTPIPLNEEWLLKLGFNISKSVEELIYWKKFDKILDFELFRKIGYNVFYIETRFNTVQISTVHQLQNLYFALTGEELEIK